MAIKVKLRKKAITGKRHSLYLDFYPAITVNGKETRREFLGKYLFDKPNEVQKIHNKETENQAELLRQKRLNELSKPEIYTDAEALKLAVSEKGKMNFVEYFKKLADKRKGSNSDNWGSAYKYLLAYSKEYFKGKMLFSDVNVEVLEDFKDYILTVNSNKSAKVNLSQNSALSYFNKVKATLKQAFKDGYLSTDLNAKIEPIAKAETHRNFLTMEELERLAKTECLNPLLKRMALFSALSGLRFSDIAKLKWCEVEEIEGNYYIQFIQQKTTGAERMPIAEQAFILMGDRKAPNDKVFEGLKYSAYHNRHLHHWLGLAGITKYITFHCFRHTYSVLQLQSGTSMYTLSKMLGHKDIKTTQIYAHIVDEAKQKASGQIVLKNL